MWLLLPLQIVVPPLPAVLALISHGNNRTRPGSTPFQDRFDWAGTFDVTAWLCVPEAIPWMGKLLPGGWRELRQRNRESALKARKVLCERWGVESSSPDEMIGSIATIPLPQRFQGKRSRGNIDNEQLVLYDRFGIAVPVNRFGNPGRRWLRVSAQVYHSLTDYEYLAASMQRL